MRAAELPDSLIAAQPTAVARKAISPGSRTLYALNMPAPRVRA